MHQQPADDRSASGRPWQVSGIDHVTLVVADLDRSQQFYCGVLGMECVPRPAFNFPGRWFQVGGQQIHLILEHPGSAPAGFPGPPATASAGRCFHFAFEVPDANSALARLKSCGVPLRGEPKLRPDGCLQVFCLDPDGHVVELFSRPAAAA
jgi:catechol 2,3-dioxygenase-like lactoylglutathione lyase family enzyme